MLDLYHNGSSVCAAKVRILLAEKNIPWTGHYLDVLAGDQFDPDYLKLDPRAVVPTMCTQIRRCVRLTPLAGRACASGPRSSMKFFPRLLSTLPLRYRTGIR